MVNKSEKTYHSPMMERLKITCEEQEQILFTDYPPLQIIKNEDFCEKHAIYSESEWDLWNRRVLDYGMLF